ncbi:MAG: murein biosynthesis integral membrane protein MurJ [Terriglobia bacterium]
MPSKLHLLRSSMVVGLFSFLGSLTGILVEISIAAHLGLSRSSDAFYIAYTIPYIITNLISATGQFSLVPFFSAFDVEARSGEIWRGFSYAINIVILGLALIGIAGAALAPWLIRLIAPGFTVAQSTASAQLARLLMFIIIPAGVAEIFRSFLFSQHRFALGSAAGFFRNVMVIGFILFGFRRYGDISIVMGYFTGYFAQLIILGGEVLWSFPVQYTLTARGGGGAIRKLHGAGASQLLAAMGWQAVVLVERVIASFLPPGTITALNYGLKIMSTISELVVGSVGTGSLPSLSRAVAQNARAAALKITRDAVEISLFLITPIMVCCLLLPRPIMQLVFQRGSFSPGATDRMAVIFFFYCLSLLSFSAVRLMTYYLFAHHEMQAFLRISLLYYGGTAALDLVYVMVLHLGAKGIPLALLTSLTATCIVIYVQDLASVRRVFEKAINILIGKAAVAALVAAGVIWMLRGWIQAPPRGLPLLLFLCAVCGAGCLAFAVVLAAWRAISFAQFMQLWQKPQSE